MHSMDSGKALLHRKLKKWLRRIGIRGASGGILDQQGGQTSTCPQHGIPHAHISEKPKSMNKKFKLNLIWLWCKTKM